MTEKTKANSKMWDSLADIHYKKYHIQKLINNEPLLDKRIINEVGDVKGKNLIHLLCHIGTDTLSWGLLGAKITGVDISSNSIKYATKLSEQTNIKANFIQSDVMDISSSIIGNNYDIVYCSIGVLCWIPDIKKFFKIVRSLLKKDGIFYMLDGHPIRNIFYDEQNDIMQKTLCNDYFSNKVMHYKEKNSDYTDPTFSKDGDLYEWDWTLADVITSICESNLKLLFLHEFPHYFYGGYDSYEEEGNFSLSGNNEFLYPCTFSVKAQAI